MSRTITFLSDYGYSDEFAGVCRAVMARIAPDSRIIDVTHGVRRHAVRQGAILLANSLPHAEPGVHLAVVDPGVGSERRPVALLANEDRILVGPDNGVLAPATAALGGAREAVDLSASQFRQEPFTATFHGRDLFAPISARLAAGAALSEAGEPLDPSTLTALELPRPRIY
ncbi:MAG: SAM hydrolase/SAM-dependent halogenase family protein, partial [Solirubrobacterales bacterium]